jgi:hypothetical protein
MIKRAFLFLGVTACALPLPAKILYFATFGNDASQCTVTAPCKSFAALIPTDVQALNGDTIMALDGVDFTAGGNAPGVLSRALP